MKKINWKVFLMLWIASTLSVVAVLPYTLDLQSSTLQQLDLPIPLPLLIAVQMLQNSILFAIMIFIGMVLANRIGLGMPILDALSKKESTGDQWRSILPTSILLGVIASVLIVAMDLFVFNPLLMNDCGDGFICIQSIAHERSW